MPAFKGFWVREIPQPAELKPEWLEQNGERFGRVAMLRRALFPLQAGRFTIEPTEVDLVARMAEIGPFGTPFGRSETLHLKTEPIALEVLALPPRRPTSPARWATSPSRPGSTAPRSRSARLPRSRFAPPGTATCRACVRRSSSIPDGIRVFPPRQESAERLTDGSLVSSQEWSYVLVPQRPGSFELPALALPYFDPAAKEFRSASTRPLVLAVTGDPPAAANPAARSCRLAPRAAQPRRMPRKPRPGRPLRQDLALGRGRRPPRRRPAGAPERRGGRAGAARPRGAGRSLAAALRAIEAAAAKATPRETAAELEEALRHHLESRFEIAPGTPVSHWHARLTAAKVDPAAATELAELTKELHYLRYAPELAAADELRADALSRARRLARALR